MHDLMSAVPVELHTTEPGTERDERLEALPELVELSSGMARKSPWGEAGEPASLIPFSDILRHRAGGC